MSGVALPVGMAPVPEERPAALGAHRKTAHGRAWESFARAFSPTRPLTAASAVRTSHC